MEKQNTTDDVAERYRTSPATVRYWRHVGIGPVGVRIGKRVLYSESDLIAWEQRLRADQHGLTSA